MTDQHVTCELCAPTGSVARPRVLVIDDEEAIRSALGRALAAEGLVTDPAGTAADGLGRARAEVYDLVILDLLMPGTDGSAVLRQLLRDRPGQPSWSCPAWPRCGCKVDCFDLGARDYLTKPFSLDELLARVRNAAWVDLVLLNLVAIAVLPSWDTVPFHLISAGFAVLYALRLWPARSVRRPGGGRSVS